MAIAFDAKTESVRTDTSDPYTFSHSGRAEGSGGVQGVCVMIAHGTNSTDYVTGVTYGGVSLSRVATAADTTTEPGRAYLYYYGGTSLVGLGGSQTVSVDLTTGTTDDIVVEVVTFTAASATEVVDFDIVEENIDDPSVTLTYSSRTCVAVAGMYSGHTPPTGGVVTAGTNCTLMDQQDLGGGAYGTSFERQTTPGSADFTIAFASLFSDDVAFVAAAFSEVGASAARNPKPPLGAAHQAIQRSATR